MTRKLTFLTLVTAALLSQGQAFAQDKSDKGHFFETVPRHEFFIEGFGGLGSLLYKVDGQQNFIGGGYGAGLGYIWHITPVVGLMTGAEFAVRNGGIDFRDASQTLYTAEYNSLPAYGWQQFNLIRIDHYRETQKNMAVQIPLMLHLMVPMGKGSHFFYAALGGKAGINVFSTFRATGDDLRYASSTDRYEDALAAIKASGNLLPGYDTYDTKGQLRLKRLNVIASVELGFRWKLSGCIGLYSGLYADYGFLNLGKARGALVTYERPIGGPDPQALSPAVAQSVLNAQGAPEELASGSGALPPAARRVGAFGAGLILKLSFGKVKAKTPVPETPPQKPDTLVRTVIQTVVVQDTVVRQNTVVVRDTVEKVQTVVVRDTVVVVKEIPNKN